MGPPKNIDRVVHGGAAAALDAVEDGGAHGHFDHRRVGDLAGDGDHLAGDGDLVHRPADIDQGAHVGHHGAHVLGQAQGRDGLAGDFLDQDEFVARRVEVVQLEQLQAGAFHGPGKGVRHIGVLAFDADDAAAGAGDAHQLLHGGHDGFGVLLHDVLVRVEQWLTLTAVGNHRIHLGVVLDVGGKTRTAFAHHAGVGYQFYKGVFIHNHASCP